MIRKKFGMKSILITVFSVFCLFSLPSSSFASSGWDYVTSCQIYADGYNTSCTGYSTGGDFRVNLDYIDKSPAGSYVTVELLEDGYHVRSIAVPIDSGGSAEAVFRDIGSYVDGSNNKAEFTVRVSLPYDEYVLVRFYD